MQMTGYYGWKNIFHCFSSLEKFPQDVYCSKSINNLLFISICVKKHNHDRYILRNMLNRNRRDVIFRPRISN